MRFFVGLILLSAFLQACSKSSEFQSKNPNAAYFYPADTIPKIYLYRDVAHGLEEEFHRIYTLRDKEGAHVIVERYSSDGRILEAMNYNVDSLNVQDQMIVDRFQKKEKAILYKTDLFPMDLKKKTWFASKFHGVVDSTLILEEIKRSYLKTKEVEFMDEKAEALVFDQEMKLTVLNPFTKKEDSRSAHSTTYFAKGYGLVEWHNASKSVHFRLEQVLDQKEWVQIITR